MLPIKLNDYMFNPREYEFVERVAFNCRHSLQLFYHKSTGHHVVIKFMPIPYDRYNKTTRISKRLLAEIDCFRNAKGHESIVNIYGTTIVDNHVLLYMEHMDCSLHNLISWVHKLLSPSYHEASNLYMQPQKFDEYMLKQIIKSLVDALSFLESINILHRDIKPHNVLLNTKGEIKLCDFGESILLEGKFFEIYLFMF